MNFSIEQSEVNEMTARLKQFSELVDLYLDSQDKLDNKE